MRAGKMDRQIVIQSRTTAQSATGAVVETWGTHATVWAQIVPKTGREYFARSEVEQAEANMLFRIRYRSDLKHEMRVSFDGDIYDIMSITEMPRREGLELVCKAYVE